MKSFLLLVAVLINSIIVVNTKEEEKESFEARQNADGQCCLAGTGQINVFLLRK